MLTFYLGSSASDLGLTGRKLHAVVLIRAPLTSSLLKKAYLGKGQSQEGQQAKEASVHVKPIKSSHIVGAGCHLIDAMPLNFHKTSFKSTNWYVKALLDDLSILQPDRGDDQEEGEDDHEEVEDEDAGEDGGQLVHQPREAEMSLLRFSQY